MDEGSQSDFESVLSIYVLFVEHTYPKWIHGRISISHTTTCNSATNSWRWHRRHKFLVFEYGVVTLLLQKKVGYDRNCTHTLICMHVLALIPYVAYH